MTGVGSLPAEEQGTKVSHEHNFTGTIFLRTFPFSVMITEGNAWRGNTQGIRKLM